MSVGRIETERLIIRPISIDEAQDVFEWAYENLGAHDFFARHANANYASGNVIKKCGFQFEKYGKLEKYDGSEIFEASYYKLHIE